MNRCNLWFWSCVTQHQLFYFWPSRKSQCQLGLYTLFWKNNVPFSQIYCPKFLLPLNNKPLYIACIVHSVHCFTNSYPPSKIPPHLLCQAPPLKSANFPSPLFRQFSPTYWFFLKPPPLLKVKLFSEPNPIPCFKIFQFKFFFLTEENIFAYKLFLLVNISDFIFF